MSQSLTEDKDNLSKLTTRTYDHVLWKFRKYVGASSEEQLLTSTVKDIEQDMADFLKARRDKSYKTRCVYSSALRSFYRSHGIVFDHHFSLYPDNQEKARSLLNGGRPAHSYAEIARLLLYSPDRDKSAIALLATTAIQPRTLCSLKLANLIPLRTGAIVFNVREGQQTFCTPQAGRFFRGYLDIRRSQGEEITADSPVLTGYFEHRGHYLSFIALYKSIQEVAVDAGIREYNDDNKLASTGLAPLLAGFRYFALDRFEQAGISPDYIDLLAGRKPKHPTADTTIETLYRKYHNAIPLLTFPNL